MSFKKVNLISILGTDLIKTTYRISFTDSTYQDLPGNLQLCILDIYNNKIYKSIKNIKIGDRISISVLNNYSI